MTSAIASQNQQQIQQLYQQQEHLATLSALADSSGAQDTASLSRQLQDFSLAQPRSRLFSAEELALQAADAYKDNAHYRAIEEETLKATAPFADIQKRATPQHLSSDALEAGSSPGALRTRAYSHARKQSLTPNASPVRLMRGRSGSHACAQDSAPGSTDSSSPYLDSSSPIGRRISGLNAAAGSAKLRSNSLSAQQPVQQPSNGAGALPFNFSPNAGINPLELAAFQNTMAQLAYQQLTPQQATVLGSLYGMDPVTTAQNLSALQQYRMRTMSLTAAARAKQSNGNVASPVGDLAVANAAALAVAAASNGTAPPDPLFAFTNFVVDSVRSNTVSHAELVEKERLRQELEAVLQALQPTARLVVYGSLANNLAISNCDMDLMVVDTSSEALHDVSVDLPAIYTEALNAQGYSVKLLSKTRTPIVKVNLEHMAVPYCVNISFDNALALHNTKLIATYAACDPRMPVMLMFVKLWTAVRRINDPHSGTLSSYGYALLLIYYLQNRCPSPPVLPNLQLISAMGSRSADELECSGYDIWFFKDVEKVQHAQIVKNASSIGTLLEGFFSYFAYEFDFRDLCISIRTPGGIVTKTVKNWTQMVEHLNDRGDAKVKDRYILSIEDPFEIAHNVGRSVTRAGLYEIRGEFMAATRYVRGNKLDEILNPHRREIVAPTSSTAMHSSPIQQQGHQQPISPGETSPKTHQQSEEQQQQQSE